MRTGAGTSGRVQRQRSGGRWETPRPGSEPDAGCDGPETAESGWLAECAESVAVWLAIAICGLAAAALGPAPAAGDGDAAPLGAMTAAPLR